MITFIDCVNQCIENKQFMDEYRRMSWSKIGKTTPVEKLIDQATGNDRKEVQEFLEFIDECVWKPLLEESKKV